MNLETLVFYFFASLMVVASIAVISLKNAVKSVLSLVVAFFCGAALWLLLEAEFLAISLVLVYVGAVMVLFLFVVMMLDIERPKIKKKQGLQILLAIVTAFLLLVGLYLALNAEHFGTEVIPSPEAHPLEYSNVIELGRLLYTEYFYAFEIAGVILLVAIIAAISLTFRGRLERRGQSIRAQHKVSKEERLRVVSIDTELTPSEQAQAFEQQESSNKESE